MVDFNIGEVPERLNGTLSKSVVASSATVGSNPTLSAGFPCLNLIKLMDIKYKDKPSKKQIKYYTNKLEEFLSAHNASISVELWNDPLYMESFENGNLTKRENIWIKRIKISTPKVKEISVFVFSEGIDENMTDEKIWHDAHRIQDQLYKYLNLVPEITPSISNDPYWEIWKHLKDLK